MINLNLTGMLDHFESTMRLSEEDRQTHLNKSDSRQSLGMDPDVIPGRFDIKLTLDTIDNNVTSGQTTLPQKETPSIEPSC